MLRSGAVLLTLLALLTGTGAAQNCEIVSSGTTTRQNAGTPYEVLAITQPVVVCPGGRRIVADNAVLSQASRQISLYGNVHFQDSARVLTSAQAQYFSQQRILAAQGNAVLVHRTTNSVIRSENIEYREATPERSTSLVRATAGQVRARAILRQAGEPDSTTLDAQQIDIVGEDLLRGTGDALLTRDSLRATAYVVEYSQTSRVLDVSGLGARIEVPRYTLFGDSITAQLNEAEQLQDVLTRHNTRLESEEMTLTAPAAKLFFDSAGVNRLVAMNWEPMPGAERAPRPHVENDQFRMDADSLDVAAPQQRITEAVAIGNAYGERITPDSLKALLPEADSAVLRLIANDWMRGDTVRAFFTDNPRAAQDTAAEERTLERLIARGDPAQSMYRMRDRDRPDLKLSLNYMVGTAIEVRFRDGSVEQVYSPDAVGVFLQPAEAARRAGGTSGGGGGRDRLRRP